MKLKDIMKPWEGEPVVCEGIAADRELSSLQEAALDPFPDKVPLVDGEGCKVGEIKKKWLRNLLRAYSPTLMLEMLDQFDDAIFATDENGIIFYANRTYSTIFGIPIGKVLGRSVYDAEPNAALLTVLKERRAVVSEKRYVQTVDKYVACKILPIFVAGQFRGAVSIFSDASEILNLNRQVRQAKQVASDLRRQMQTILEREKFQIIGKEPAFLNMLSQATIVAKTDVPVLIRGESGTGKELIAKFIHRSSDRSSQPLITVNCAAIPENLIESELFGYEEGAFTGSKRGGKLGKFELANGGTLFLDEIGDMSLSVQTKLLRAIQENEIEKIGRERRVPVNVRILAATNQPLEEFIESKQFRQDFYYRINTVTLTVPPLRERRSDIILLANFFLSRFNEKYRKSVSYSQEVLAWFYHYDWPGNIREMENCVENGVIMSQNGVFDVENLTQHMGAAPQPAGLLPAQPAGSAAGAAFARGREQAELQNICRALLICNGNRTAAMNLLGYSRRTFYRRLKQYGLTAPYGEKSPEKP